MILRNDGNKKQYLAGAVTPAEREEDMKNMNKVIKHLEKRVERLKKLAEKDISYLDQLEKEERDLDYYKVYG